jgi:hypothetical protein
VRFRSTRTAICLIRRQGTSGAAFWHSGRAGWNQSVVSNVWRFANLYSVGCQYCWEGNANDFAFGQSVVAGDWSGVTTHRTTANGVSWQAEVPANTTKLTELDGYFGGYVLGDKIEISGQKKDGEVPDASLDIVPEPSFQAIATTVGDLIAKP